MPEGIEGVTIALGMALAWAFRELVGLLKVKKENGSVERVLEEWHKSERARHESLIVELAERLRTLEQGCIRTHAELTSSRTRIQIKDKGDK